MAKSKEQKRQEAKERAISNIARRTDDLILWVRQHHADLALVGGDRWTVNMLRNKVTAFYQHLHACGLPHDVGAFYVTHNKVLIAQYPTGDYKRSRRRCLYCLQPLGQYHKAPCANETSGRVSDAEALFIDERN